MVEVPNRCRQILQKYYDFMELGDDPFSRSELQLYLAYFAKEKRRLFGRAHDCEPAGPDEGDTRVPFQLLAVNAKVG